MKKWAALVLGFSIGAGFLCGTTWNASFEAIPDGATDLVSDLDTFIKNFKVEVRNRGSVETIYGTGSNDNGLLRLGAGRSYIQNGAPTDIVGPGAYVSSSGTFSALPLGTNEPNGTIDIGTGRFWVDLDGDDNTAGTTDDRQLKVWADTVGWSEVTTENAHSLGQNLVYNGSFEITDGTGSLASTTRPSGWGTTLGAPTFAYALATATEGDGAVFQVTANGADEGAAQTVTGLKASTVYVVRARANATTAADTCDLSVTGGTATVTDTTATTAAFETLEVQVTTSAVPADLVVRLEANVATDVCRFDHVTLFEKEASVSTPGIQIATQFTNVSTALTNAFAGAPNPLMTRTVTPAISGAIVRVYASVTLQADTQNSQVTARLQENGVTVALSACATTQNAAGIQACTVPLHHMNVNPAPGTTLAYTVDARDAGAGGATFNPVIGGADQTTSRLTVELIPTR